MTKYLDKNGLINYEASIKERLEDKQDTLVSGTNIKTINNESLLGSGNINISSGGTATDVRINGTSITSNDVADIQTEGTYNATTNKIATMSDIPTVPTVGNAKTYYGISSTGASTAAKTVTCSGFTLETGATIFVKFTNANSYNGTATLNVNSTGAKDIAIVGDTKTSRYYWKSGEVVGFIYDGTNYVMIEQGNATTTYYGVTKLSNSTSSTSEVLAATPKAVKTAYDLANGKQNAITSTNKLDYSLIDNTPTIPSKTSDLTNDSGFITGYTETDPVFSASAAAGITSSDITNWNNKSTFSGNYNDLTNKPTIPDELSDLSDDSTHRLVTDTEKTTWNNKSNFSGSYNDLTNKPTIPDSTSDLTNDSGFIDNTVSNLTNYTTTTALNTLLGGKVDYGEISSSTFRVWDLDPGFYKVTSSRPTMYYNGASGAGTTRVWDGSIVIIGAVQSTRKTFLVISGGTDTSTQERYFNNYVGYTTSTEGVCYETLNTGDVVDNLTSSLSESPLSAKQGKALKDLIDTMQDQVDANTSNIISNNGKIGTLSSLTTTDKTDLVSAINEVKGDIPSVPVTDVQIGGTSILSSGIANIKSVGLYNATSNKLVDELSLKWSTGVNNSVGDMIWSSSGTYKVGQLVTYNYAIYRNKTGSNDPTKTPNMDTTNWEETKGLLDVIKDTGWVNMTSSKGTWDYLKYRVIGRVVYIKGYATAYTWSGSTGENFTSIPVQYAPSDDNINVNGNSGGRRISRIYITPAGNIGLDYICLIDNGSLVTASTWIRFNVSYPLD